jgi:hypothetical protein
VYCRYCSPPGSHQSSLQQQLLTAATLAEQDDISSATQVLDHLIEWHLEDFLAAASSDNPVLPDATSSSSSSSSSSSGNGHLQALFRNIRDAAAAPGSLFLVPACIYALLLNTHDAATKDIVTAGCTATTVAAADGSSSTASSSSPTPMETAGEDMFDALDSASSPLQQSDSGSSSSSRQSIVSSKDSTLQRLVKYQLDQLTKEAPQDCLGPAAASLERLLGRQHPVAAAMQLLAERNMSLGARQARELRRQQRQLAQATELLKVQGQAGQAVRWQRPWLVGMQQPLLSSEIPAATNHHGLKPGSVLLAL